jgi:hypothetical protein
MGNLGVLVVIGPCHGGDRLATNHGQPAIFVNGTPAPPVTSFVVFKSFYRSVDAINTHVMTLAGDASFNDGIFLVVAAVDRTLK